MCCSGLDALGHPGSAPLAAKLWPAGWTVLELMWWSLPDAAPLQLAASASAFRLF